jgi:DNA topoisomerase-1
LAGRNSGHLRIERTYFRRGDQAQMATISFVDDLKVEVKAKPKAKTVTKAKPATPAAKKPAARRPAAKRPAARKAGAKA